MTAKKPIKPRRTTPKTGGKRSTKKRREWEPSANQLAMYEKVKLGWNYSRVAAEFGCVISNVSQTCAKIDDWLAVIYLDRVRQIRVRQTQQLEHIFGEAMEAWEKSKSPEITEAKEQGDVDGKPSTKQSKKKVHKFGNPAFLGEARGALADIRKIHCVDKNPKIDEMAGTDDAGDRVAGKNRELIIQERINALNASLKMSQALSQATADIPAEQTTEQAG